MIYDVLNSIPLPRRKGPLTALDSVPFHGRARSGHINGAYDIRMSIWTSKGFGRSPAAERFLLHVELKMTPMIR